MDLSDPEYDGVNREGIYTHILLVSLCFPFLSFQVIPFSVETIIMCSLPAFCDVYRGTI